MVTNGLEHIQTLRSKINKNKQTHNWTTKSGKHVMDMLLQSTQCDNKQQGGLNQKPRRTTQVLIGRAHPTHHTHKISPKERGSGGTHIFPNPIPCFDLVPLWGLECDV